MERSAQPNPNPDPVRPVCSLGRGPALRGAQLPHLVPEGLGPPRPHSSHTGVGLGALQWPGRASRRRWDLDRSVFSLGKEGNKVVDGRRTCQSCVSHGAEASRNELGVVGGQGTGRPPSAEDFWPEEGRWRGTVLGWGVRGGAERLSLPGCCGSGGPPSSHTCHSGNRLCRKGRVYCWHWEGRAPQVRKPTGRANLQDSRAWREVPRPWLCRRRSVRALWGPHLGPVGWGSWLSPSDLHAIPPLHLGQGFSGRKKCEAGTPHREPPRLCAGAGGENLPG